MGHKQEPAGGLPMPFRGANVGAFFLLKMVVKSAIRHKGARPHLTWDVGGALERRNFQSPSIDMACWKCGAWGAGGKDSKKVP